MTAPAPVRRTRGTWQWYETPEAPSPPQTPGERVLARILALGDDHPSEDYRQAIADVLAVLADCAPECHEAGHR